MAALSEKFSEVNCFGVVEAESALGGENPMEQLPVALEQTEPTRTRRVGKCNLRKSLAWDSAFFTSEGALVYTFTTPFFFFSKNFNQND